MGDGLPAAGLPMDLPFRQSTEVHRCKVLPFKEAIVVDVHESKIVDKIRLEAYKMLPRIIPQSNDERRRGSFAPKSRLLAATTRTPASAPFPTPA